MSKNCVLCPFWKTDGLSQLGGNLGNYDFKIALAGNPNVGKSTVFNNLTGLHQHTGNWPGKTVSRAEGSFKFGENKYKIVDLPGTYSLLSTSIDEEIARNYILFENPAVTLIIVDSTRLERNLNLVFQILEITDNAILVLNLLDEAERKGITINIRQLSKELGIPVVGMNARSKVGMDELLKYIDEVATKKYITKPRKMEQFSPNIETACKNIVTELEQIDPNIPNLRWISLRMLEGDQTIYDEFSEKKSNEILKKEISKEQSQKLFDTIENCRWEIGDSFIDQVVEDIYVRCQKIAEKVIETKQSHKFNWDVFLDKLFVSKFTGFPIMFLFLAITLWITIQGANIPSAWLGTLLIDDFLPILKQFTSIFLPNWLTGLLIDGGYLATAWVVSVMLPPMAIFFPLFTLLEDFGYLPRVAFNMDSIFRRVGGHGKQALTMTMGFGCNAAGVVATRIIDSPRERLIAIITNNFAMCNGRWPTQILIATIFIGTLAPIEYSSLIASAAVIGVTLLGVLLTLIISLLLSKTVLKGETSIFSFELPPYRPPRILQTLYTSLIDRTIFVLWRAILFAFPAGLVIWGISNISFGNEVLAKQLIDFLNPFGILLGLNGIIILAYLIAIPANEIVIPTILMLTTLVTGISEFGNGAGVMFETDSIADTAFLLQSGGWTLLTAINVMIFSLIHNPCSTTIYTIYKETGSIKWTSISTLIPLILGFLITYIIAQIW